MAKSVYLSRKLLNQLAAIEADSDDMMLTHDLHNIAKKWGVLVILQTS